MENTLNTYPESLYKLSREKKLPHAIIIESTDLERTYQEAIKAVNILMCNSDILTPCGSCNSCIKIANDCHPDVKVLSPDKDSKSIKVDKIRCIRQDAYIIPNESNYKVYIIKSSEYLTSQAQNAFIKILEEPPEKVIFILMCESINNLLDTILSRCVIFRDNTVSDISNHKSEIDSLSKKIVNLSIQGNKMEIMKILANINSERLYLNKLLSCIIRNFIDFIKYEKSKIDIQKIIRKIDTLKYIFEANDINVNLNLLISYLLAIL